MTKNSFWEQKSVTAIIAIVAFIGGLMFLERGISITGNIILNENFFFNNIVSLIGILLILCSGILIAYTMIKK